MKFIALLILLGLAQWYFRKPPPPVVNIVPHCLDTVDNRATAAARRKFKFTPEED